MKEPRNLGEILQGMAAKEIAATDRPDAHLMSATEAGTALEDAYRNTLTRINLVDSQSLRKYECDLLRQKEQACGQLRGIFDAFVGKQLNPAALRKALTTMDGTLRSVENLAERLGSVEWEEKTLGNGKLPVGSPVSYQGRRGVVISVSEGFKGRPYYGVHFNDLPQNHPPTFLYARMMSFEADLLKQD